MITYFLGTRKHFQVRKCFVDEFKYFSFKIPVDLFLEIQLFLNARDYWMLLSTTKKTFEEVRFSTRTITFDSVETMRLVDEPNYLRQILDKVRFPGRQLSEYRKGM
jgi:hypothetical protein